MIKNTNPDEFSSEWIIFANEDGEFASISLFDDDHSSYPSAMSFNNGRPGGTMQFRTAGITRVFLANNGNLGIGTTSPGFPLHMASGAHVTAGGVWTNASSRSLKENISSLSESDALTTLQQLVPVKYNYRNEQDEDYLGFIAEDVPELVAMKDRKSLSPMDMVALLTRVVQTQQQAISKMQEQIKQLQQQ
jgi:hypothetical protein